MIKENRSAGFIFNIIAALIITGLGIWSIYFGYTSNNVESLKKDNAIFNSESTKVKNGESVVLNVYKVFPEPIGEIDDGTLIYAIQYKKDGSLIGVQAKSGDSTIKSLIEQNDSLASNPKEVAVEYHNTRTEKPTEARIKNYSYVITTIKNSNAELKKLSGITYLSISKQDKKSWMFLGAGLIAILIGLFTAYKGNRTKKIVNETYDKLYNKYPELHNNLDLIITNSFYNNDNLKVSVYKDCLISYHKAIYFIDLTTVTTLEADSSTISLDDGLFNTRTDRFLKATGTDYHSGYKLLIKKMKKNYPENLQELLTFVQSNFSNVNQ